MNYTIVFTMKGTCKHYKKSKRWLRFSCCNRIYPCDICHDEQSDHPSQVCILSSHPFVISNFGTVGEKDDLWLLFDGTRNS